MELAIRFMKRPTKASAGGEVKPLRFSLRFGALHPSIHSFHLQAAHHCQQERRRSSTLAEPQTVDRILLSVMLVSTVVWQPRLSSLIALGYLTSVAICSYVITGDTYWSGRTQPIGIDFASDRA